MVESKPVRLELNVPNDENVSKHQMDKKRRNQEEIELHKVLK